MPKLEKSFPWILLLAHFFFNFRVFNARFPMVNGKPLSRGFPSPEQQLEAPRCIGKLKLGRGFGATEQRDAGQALQELALRLPEQTRSCSRRAHAKKPFLPAPVEANPNFFPPTPRAGSAHWDLEVPQSFGLSGDFGPRALSQDLRENLGSTVGMWRFGKGTNPAGPGAGHGWMVAGQNRGAASLLFSPKSPKAWWDWVGAGRGAAAAQARGTSRTV